jgi:hypothetical protein
VTGRQEGPGVGNKTTIRLTGEKHEGEYRNIWNDHNHRQEFEHELINRKTTWSLTARALLFTAYGLVLGAKTSGVSSKFRYIIAGAGLALAISIPIGIAALIRSKYISWKLYEHFYERCAEYPRLRPLVRLEWGVNTRNTKVTLFPDVLLPAVFATAWIVLLV